MTTLAALGWPSWQSAYRWVERYVQYGKVEILGQVLGSKDKFVNVYGKTCKADQLAHEAELSTVLVHFEVEGIPWKRGEDADGTFRADADISEYGQVFRLELDRDNERRRALAKRLGVYSKTSDFVLFVAPHDRRIKQVKEIGSFLGDQLLLTTFSKASKDPFGKNVWEDIHGNKCSF